MHHRFHQARLSDVEHDGRFISNARDPPGQRCTYIPPGDPRRESYRLSTFKDYPAYVPIDNYQFAAKGFYYTGYNDRVKCFSCGLAVEDLTRNDNPALPGFHKSHCQFNRGTDDTNVPILSFLTRPSPPSTSQSNHMPSTSGLNNHHVDRSQTTMPNTTTPSAAAVLFESASENRGDFPTSNNSSFVNQRSNESAISRENLSSTFPCLYPVNPHMRNEESRLQTFIESSSIWPAHRIRATPREIAQAGMYFLGERDRVKCWYCNGGLQNWERDDEPWEEHAKWFPLCEFVLQQKGPDFVYEIVRRFPNLRRPNLYNSANSMQLRRVLNIVQSGPTFLPLPRSSIAPSRGPVIVDPREELRERNRKIEEEMTSSELVSHAKMMGFEERFIRAAFRKNYEEKNCGFTTFEPLIETILSLDESTINGIDEDPSLLQQNNSPVSISNLSASAGLEEMRRLEESRKCKICHNEPACIVFIPCGCLVCCVECGNRTRNCPICNSTVRERVRSYIA